MFRWFWQRPLLMIFGPALFFFRSTGRNTNCDCDETPNQFTINAFWSRLRFFLVRPHNWHSGHGLWRYSTLQLYRYYPCSISRTHTIRAFAPGTFTRWLNLNRKEKRKRTIFRIAFYSFCFFLLRRFIQSLTKIWRVSVIKPEHGVSRAWAAVLLTVALVIK